MWGGRVQGDDELAEPGLEVDDRGGHGDDVLGVADRHLDEREHLPTSPRGEIKSSFVYCLDFDHLHQREQLEVPRDTAPSPSCNGLLSACSTIYTISKIELLEVRFSQWVKTKSLQKLSIEGDRGGNATREC